MAETLTYENTTETTSVDNLNADEQDSLQVGEAMIEQQEQLLAGKYKNAQELESAYVELQKKLGEKNTEDSGEAGESSDSDDGKETSEEKEETKETSEEFAILDNLWEESNSGKEISKELLDELSKLTTGELASKFIKWRADADSKYMPVKSEFSEADVSTLKNIAGGDKGYTEMLQWADKNLNKQEIDMFDQVMERGDPLAAFFAVRSLAYRWEDSKGVDGRMLTGTAPKADGNQFRSQAEVVQAMGDPRYDRDPAYRQQIMEKLERSNVNF